jgi:para-aminobenzoate synthetase/4-amino-4-deoxychorismate lyase
MVKIVLGCNSKSSDKWSVTLESPTDVLVAHRVDDVIPLIGAAEQAALRGQYVALILTYEAAPAFDRVLMTHSANSSLPLAWAGIFPTASTATDVPIDRYTTSDWEPAIRVDEYRFAVEKILRSIADGDTYQVNYSFPLNAGFAGDPLSYYVDLARAQGAQYSAFLDIGDFQILSLSPELFFERIGRQVKTKPMKGTIARGRYTAEDNELAARLRLSKKDQAENVMIVDLLRNDLGKVSETGSVHVSSLFELERFETLWQMTSTVESTLREDVGLVDLLAALFPCGSITGAPKISTMKIINRLEPLPRGVYTGAIGLLRPGGDCIFNVAIRTLQIDAKSGVMTFGVGGGVTIDSTAEREYAECLVKSAFLQQRSSCFQLLETMLLENGEYFLLDRHITRLRESADYFGFEFISDDIASSLNQIARDYPVDRWKVRLLLSEGGRFEIGVYASPVSERIRRVGFAKEAVSSSNRMLFHKTTERGMFQSALERFKDYDDVVFFNEKGEVTESANANVVLPTEDQLWTPPVSCGLLAGTFRQHLIDEGKLQERIITVKELRECGDFFLINSVQKWMKAVVSDPLQQALNE